MIVGVFASEPFAILDHLHRIYHHRSDLTFVESDNFHFYYKDFIVHKYDNGDLIIFDGRCFYNDEEVLPSKYSSKTAFVNSMKCSYGIYTCFSVEKARLECYRSLYRGKDIFYYQENKGYYISSNYAEMILLSGKHDLNLKFANDFINYNPDLGSETLVSDISQAEFGCMTSLTTTHGVDREIIPISRLEYQDTIPELQRTIRNFSRGNENIVVRFSGGLDSTLILHAAMQISQKCSLLHIINSEESTSSELAIATQIAKSLGKELIVHYVDNLAVRRSYPFEIASQVNTPFDINPIFREGVSDFDSYRQELEACKVDDALILTGHGGDHLFVQSPYVEVLSDLLKFGSVTKFVSTLNKLSRLKGDNIFILIKKALNMPRKSADILSSNVRVELDSMPRQPHIVMHEFGSSSAKIQHMRTILHGIALQHRYNDYGVPVLNPLLLQNMISRFADIPIEDTFDSDYDRIIVRRLLSHSTDGIHGWRRTKRASSQLASKFLGNNARMITDFLCDGLLVKELGINKDTLMREIQFNAEISLNESFKTIILLLQLQLFWNNVFTNSSVLEEARFS